MHSEKERKEKRRDICVSHCLPGLTKLIKGRKKERKEKKERHLCLRLSAGVI